MGIKGLSKYINANQNSILEQFYLYNSQVVIDGHSLCLRLYDSHDGFSEFGGDYDKYAACVNNFFKDLDKCNIIPYVLFDGSHETRKLRTVYKRLGQTIRRTANYTQNPDGQIPPLLVRDVFIDVLKERKVSYTVCEYEADNEIAALAKRLNCPVLSSDSDYFVYDVLYIPFNFLNKDPQNFQVNGNSVYVLQSYIYRMEKLMDHFGGLSKEMMPLLATFLGNDYVDNYIFNNLFSQLNLLTSKGQPKFIHGLVNWLHTETLDSAMAKILETLKNNNKDHLLADIEESVAGFITTKCDSIKYLDIKIQDITAEESSASSNKEKSVSENNSDEVEHNKPNWFADCIRQNRVPKYYINLYTHHLHVYCPQAEDYSDDDSCLCALPMIRFAFDLLTDFAHENFTYASRQKKNYNKLEIGKDYSISRPLEKPFTELSNDELCFCFDEFVKIKMPSLELSQIELLPPNCKIFMISVLWWVKNCSVPLNHVRSLLICYIMLEVIDRKTIMFRGHNNFINRHWDKLEQLNTGPNRNLDNTEMEPFPNKIKVRYEDCLVAASVLLKHFEIDDSVRMNWNAYDIKRMHSFAQFQCCLMHFNGINVLCSKRFMCTDYSKCFNGAFVYNLTCILENELDPENFIQHSLNGAETVFMFYRSLYEIYNRCAQKMGVTTTQPIGDHLKRSTENENETFSESQIPSKRRRW